MQYDEEGSKWGSNCDSVPSSFLTLDEVIGPLFL